VPWMYQLRTASAAEVRFLLFPSALKAAEPMSCPKSVPQGLKPVVKTDIAARLKPWPSSEAVFTEKAVKLRRYGDWMRLNNR
jgi:hypothetical protein